MNKKIPSAYTVEELLDFTEQSQIEEAIPESTGDTLAFLSTYKIQPGKDIVPQKIIYELYKLWSLEPIPKETFSKELNKYFISQIKSNRVYFLINQKAIDLSKAAYKFVAKRTVNKTKSLPWKKHFENFLEKYNITSGSYYLEAFVLYDLYDQYVYEIKKKQPLSYKQFFNFCNLYFTNRRFTRSKVTWFGVDESIKKSIISDRLKNLRESRELNVKKKNQKRRRKISRTQTSS